MLGQFIFHTCNHAGLKLKAILRNSLRNESSSDSEQVIPFLAIYTSKGGQVDFFKKSTGGHGSDACGKLVLLDVLEKIFDDKSIDVRQYDKFKYMPDNLRSPWPFIKHYLKKIRARLQ
jgi:hypothetical protein